jgi:hypothetical protein
MIENQLKGSVGGLELGVLSVPARTHEPFCRNRRGYKYLSRNDEPRSVLCILSAGRILLPFAGSPVLKILSEDVNF